MTRAASFLHWFAADPSAGALGVPLSESDDTTVVVTAGFYGGDDMAVSRTITWAVMDLQGMSYSDDTITIRRGDSLLLTATGSPNKELKIDADGIPGFELEGATPGDTLPWQYDTAGEVIVTAWVGDSVRGSVTVVVMDVDLSTPIACEVGFQGIPRT